MDNVSPVSYKTDELYYKYDKTAEEITLNLLIFGLK